MAKPDRMQYANRQKHHLKSETDFFARDFNRKRARNKIITNENKINGQPVRQVL